MVILLENNLIYGTNIFNHVNVKNKRVVDIGYYSAGMFSREIINNGGQCLAIDLNPNLKALKKGVKFLSGTTEKL